MPNRFSIGNAPNGEDTSADGTEKLPVSGSKYMLVSTIAAYIRTLTQTLTNKTIDLGSNTLTGTKAQFNTAMSDADFATLAGSETLTNKTLTAPTLADFTNAAHDHQDADDGGTLSEAALALTDVTTNNASTTKHGFLKKLDNDAGHFMNGQGDWVAPSGTSLTVEEEDGAPSVSDVTIIKVSNGTLTDNGSGSVSISTGGGGGGDVATDTIWDAKGDLAAGTGADTAQKLTVGSNGQYMIAASGQTTGLQWVTGGRVLISSATPTSTGTVSFTSIPSSYSKIIIEYVARGTQSAGSTSMDVTLNNDTTDGNYRRQHHSSHSATTDGAGGGDDNVINDAVIAATGPSGAASYGMVEIPFYAGTTFNKQIRSHHTHRRDTSAVHEQIDYRGLDWESTSAVSRVDFILASGDFDAGTEFRLYGEY